MALGAPVVEEAAYGLEEARVRSDDGQHLAKRDLARDVARECQVICITHSPQVASAGDQHLLVSKTVRGGVTETQIKALDSNAREREIARMLGATEATAASVAHARDLIATATSGD